MLQTFINIVHVFVCLVLVLVVLLQQGKGGGMGAAFGGATTQVFGGRGAGNILTKATAVCAAIFMLTSVSLAYLSSSGDRALKAKIAQEAGRRKDRGELKERVVQPAQPGAATPAEQAPGGEPPKDESTPGTGGEPATPSPDSEPTTGKEPAGTKTVPAAPAPKKAETPVETKTMPAAPAPKGEAPNKADAPAAETKAAPAAPAPNPAPAKAEPTPATPAPNPAPAKAETTTAPPAPAPDTEPSKGETPAP